MSLRNEGFGRILRGWRDEVGLTQTELAGRVGLAQRTVSQWETRGMAFDSAKLRLLDKALGFAPGTAAAKYLESADRPDSETPDQEALELLEAKLEELKRGIDEANKLLRRLTG